MRVLYKACPLCNSDSTIAIKKANCSRHTLYQEGLPKLLIWLRCTACNHVFTDSYFSEEGLKLLFSKTQESQIVGYNTEGQRYISAKILDKVIPYVDSCRKEEARLPLWLDVGFGDGSLLFTAKEYGFEPVGIDLRQDNVNLLKSCNIRAHAIRLDQVSSLGLKFDVISMCDVLEHMSYPKQALTHAYGLLNDSGMLFLSLPNMDSMLWELLDEANPYWGEIEHYHNFGKNRLYDLLKEVGFTPIRYSISERYRLGMEIICKK